jgi:hypothetical protein
MAKLRSVNTHFWDDTYVVDLDPIEKLLFLYFLTNPLTNISGAYEISLRRIAFDTGIDSDMIVKILARFESADKMIYRDGWIFITNFIKNQSLNPKITKGIEIAAKCCPDWIKDRLSIGFDSLSIDYDNLNLNSNSNTNSNSNGGSPPAGSVAAPTAENPNEAFDSVREEFLAAVKAVYGGNTLSRADRWIAAIESAIIENIPIKEFIEEFQKLLDDPKRKYSVTPDNVLTACLEARARRKPKIEAPPKPQYESRNAEMEARGFPKMEVSH